jgi:hypothetical protein
MVSVFLSSFTVPGLPLSPFLGDPLRNETWQALEFKAAFCKKNDGGPVDKSDLIQIKHNRESLAFD